MTAEHSAAALDSASASAAFAPLFVVPTRNRAGLAQAAMASVLAAPEPRLTLWISDNSTVASESEALQRACKACGDARLHYRQPPRPLAMGSHWEWLVQQALRHGHFTHVCFLTDRMMFVPGGVATLLGVASRHPQALVAYPNDHIDDLQTPVLLNQHDWTGRVLRARSDDFLVYMRSTSWSSALPRLLNCMVPCELFRRIDDFYGSACDGTSPDVCFGFRALEREEAYLFIDKPLIVDYAISRSNGHSARRGELTQDYKDFLANLGPQPAFHAAPMPGIPGTTNAVVHEYNLVRSHSGSLKFKPWNLGVYFKLVDYDLRDIEDATQVAELRGKIREFRRQFRKAGRLRRDLWRARAGKLSAKLSPRYLAKKIVKTLSQKRPNYHHWGWRMLRHLGLLPYAVRQRITYWASTAEAVDYLRAQPLPRQPARSEFEYRVRAQLAEIAEP